MDGDQKMRFVVMIRKAPQLALSDERRREPVLECVFSFNPNISSQKTHFTETLFIKLSWKICSIAEANPTFKALIVIVKFKKLFTISFAHLLNGNTPILCLNQFQWIHLESIKKILKTYSLHVKPCHQSAGHG